MVGLAVACAVLLVGVELALVVGYSLVDVLLAIESTLLAVVGLPLSVRGTIRLIATIRESTVEDRLARAIVAYLTLVTIAAIVLVILTLYRFLTDQTAPDWLRPVTGLLLLMICVGPAYVDDVAGRPRGSGRPR